MTVCAAAERTPSRTLYHYSPWHDKRFDRDVARDLLRHVGEWRRPGHEALTSRGATADSAELALATCRAVDRLRRVGLVIDAEGGHGGRGYRLVDIDPPRYLHLHEHGTDDEPHGQVDGQLSMDAP